MKRVVIKIGTKVLSKEDKTLDIEFLGSLVAQIAELKKQGLQVVLVSSGAVGAGRSILSLPETKSETVEKQIFAAVGQVKLMSSYSELFAAHNFHCAQVLATKEDFRDEMHYTNMQNCFEGLLLDNVVPIVNENDVVATAELMFTDNDELAGLVAEQLRADSLIILTGTDGVLDAAGNTISEVRASNSAAVAEYITPDTSTGGRGGMLSKFTVAKTLAEKGIAVFIANGRRENVLLSIAQGRGAGTHFAAKA